MSRCLGIFLLLLLLPGWVGAETVYRDQLKPALMIGRISFLMADNRSRIALALQDLANARAADDPTATVSARTKSSSRGS